MNRTRCPMVRCPESNSGTQLEAAVERCSYAAATGGLWSSEHALEAPNVVRPANRFDVFRLMLADLGFAIQPHMQVLDFGAGEGKLVSFALAQGFDAYGCDLYDVKYSYTLDRDPKAAALREQGRLRRIRTPYRLPFEDSSIDVVISDQVFEHVL